MYRKKAANTKFLKSKKPQEASSKRTSTEEKINSDPNVQKFTTRSGSRLKSVSEKLKNHFSEKNETDDGFVSRKIRKKKWNQKEKRVCPEHRVKEHNYLCIWQCCSFLAFRHLV